MRYLFLFLLFLLLGGCGGFEHPSSASLASKSQLLPKQCAIKAKKKVHQLPDRFGFNLPPPPPPPFYLPPEAEIELIEFPEISPGFPGGTTALNNYLVKNLKYPAMALEMGIQGKVYVEFSVMPDGAIDELKILRGVDPSLDREAIRVLRNMPKWIPAESQGRHIKRTMVLPIRFVID